MMALPRVNLISSPVLELLLRLLGSFLQFPPFFCNGQKGLEGTASYGSKASHGSIQAEGLSISTASFIYRVHSHVGRLRTK